MSVSLHDQSIFMLHGYSVYDPLFQEIIRIDRGVFSECIGLERIVVNDDNDTEKEKGEERKSREYVQIPGLFIDNFSEKWRTPIMSDFREKIDERYGIKPTDARVFYFSNGLDFRPYISWAKNATSKLNNGIFIVFFGSSRYLISAEKTGTVENTETFIMNDGDLLFFNKKYITEHVFSIPINELQGESIMILYS